MPTTCLMPFRNTRKDHINDEGEWDNADAGGYDFDDWVKVVYGVELVYDRYQYPDYLMEKIDRCGVTGITVHDRATLRGHADIWKG